jgi:hypothetical protein
VRNEHLSIGPVVASFELLFQYGLTPVKAVLFGRPALAAASYNGTTVAASLYETVQMLPRTQDTIIIC